MKKTKIIGFFNFITKNIQIKGFSKPFTTRPNIFCGFDYSNGGSSKNSIFGGEVEIDLADIARREGAGFQVESPSQT